MIRKEGRRNKNRRKRGTRIGRSRNKITICERRKKKDNQERKRN